MAELRYIPAPPRANNADAEAQYRQARAENERMHVRERELRIAKAKQELIPRSLAQKQAAFLILSLRTRLLSLPAELGVSKEIEEKVASKLRSTLDELVDFPERVSDPEWMLKLR